MGVEDPVGELEKILDSITPSQPDADAELGAALIAWAADGQTYFDCDAQKIFCKFCDARESWSRGTEHDPLCFHIRALAALKGETK